MMIKKLSELRKEHGKEYFEKVSIEDLKDVLRLEDRHLLTDRGEVWFLALLREMIIMHSQLKLLIEKHK